MIKYYIPCELRKMRLDRILLKKESQWAAHSPVTIFANKPIDRDDYLFQSDHFGLLIELKPTNKLPTPYHISSNHVALPKMNFLGKVWASLYHVGRLLWLYKNKNSN